PSLNFQNRQPESLAKTRGRDWALQDASANTVAVSRPVVVECHPDRLRIVADDGRSISKEIQFGPSTDDSVDEFRTAVWDHMKGWGKAGRGLYWRPSLAVRVAPDGRARFTELQALFKDSGLDLHESVPKSPATAAPQKKSVRK